MGSSFVHSVLCFYSAFVPQSLIDSYNFEIMFGCIYNIGICSGCRLLMLFWMKKICQRELHYLSCLNSIKWLDRYACDCLWGYSWFLSRIVSKTKTYNTQLDVHVLFLSLWVTKGKLSLLAAAPDSIAKRRIYSEAFVNQRSWELNICMLSGGGWWSTLKEMDERLMQTKSSFVEGFNV